MRSYEEVGALVGALIAALAAPAPCLGYAQAFPSRRRARGMTSDVH